MKIDLLNCMKCGKKPKICSQETSEINSSGEETTSSKFYHVECPNCGEKAEKDFWIEGAVQLWNNKIIHHNEIYWRFVKNMLDSEAYLKEKNEKLNKDRDALMDENGNWRPINELYKRKFFEIEI